MRRWCTSALFEALAVAGPAASADARRPPATVAARAPVVEAAVLLEETERQIVAVLRDRRIALRAGGQQDGAPGRVPQDTEQLRLTLRTYREVAERLLRA
ncbi:hypothetical protein ACFV5J_28080 [Streptomyces zaomyceticus]|uniref:hypothetical protein n=1 Tax=Streptomyces zaomyceticus TaxID=68286 RepID=UPI0036559A2F